jgi:hypothetical protein
MVRAYNGPGSNISPRLHNRKAVVLELYEAAGVKARVPRRILEGLSTHSLGG